MGTLSRVNTRKFGPVSQLVVMPWTPLITRSTASLSGMLNKNRSSLWKLLAVAEAQIDICSNSNYIGWSVKKMLETSVSIIFINRRAFSFWSFVHWLEDRRITRLFLAICSGISCRMYWKFIDIFFALGVRFKQAKIHMIVDLFFESIKQRGQDGIHNQFFWRRWLYGRCALLDS